MSREVILKQVGTFATLDMSVWARVCSVSSSMVVHVASSNNSPPANQGGER